ncbi:MAG: hypothetical protein ACFCUS_03000 [Rubrimonas sp.]|uniref:hypothetical protein n=1 Tax=Rubrimonas sp. TaxID=2036015 RepID=UPI002FDD9286
MIEHFEPLSPAERAVIADVASGAMTRLGAAPPEPDARERVVRAELLRLLLLGGPGVPRMHEKGMRISGALIEGPLDLEGCRLGWDLHLADCRFDSALVLRSAALGSLLLDGSQAPGLWASGLETRGHAHLRAVAVDGPVDVSGARIGGALTADGARIERPGGVALFAEGIEARGGMLLRGAEIRGTVALPGARIGADLDLTGARIEAARDDALRAQSVKVDLDLILRRASLTGRCALTGAHVGGDADFEGCAISAPGDDALSLNRARVDGMLILRGEARIEGLLNLNATSVEALVDAPDSWPGPGDLAINRFLYNAFLNGPTDAPRRLDWLERQSPERWGEDFQPQPYEQAAAVLAATGHGEDAQSVMVAKERLQRRARRRRASPWAWRAFLWFSDGLLRITLSYGRRPLRAFLWLAMFWGIGVAMFSAAEFAGALRPAPVVAQRSPEWVLCGATAAERVELPSLGLARAGIAAPGQTQLDCYLGQPEAASFQQFNAWMYSLDVILPAAETGQLDAWAPDQRHPLGALAQASAYALTVIGWALSLLAVAGFSGIVRAR